MANSDTPSQSVSDYTTIKANTGDAQIKKMGHTASNGFASDPGMMPRGRGDVRELDVD